MLSLLNIAFLFLSYCFLKAYDLRATVLLGLFIRTLSLLILYSFPYFPYVSLIALVLISFVTMLGQLVPYYFAMKWFKTEIRFFITSILIFASNLFPSRIAAIFITTAADTH